jgi:hypothetical protein
MFLSSGSWAATTTPTVLCLGAGATSPLSPMAAPSPQRRRQAHTRALTPMLRLLFPTSTAAVIAVVVCVLVPASLLSLQITSNGKFSPFDEAAHLDYVERASRAEVPRQGDKMLASSMREISCAGYQGESFDHLPSCDSPHSSWPRSMLWNQHEAQQPPTYYFLTAPLRWLSHNVVGISGDLQATRFTSIAWAVIGLILLWAAGRVMSIVPTMLGAALILLITSPWILYLNATVSNDVTALPAAGLVALGGALAYRRPAQWHMPMLVAVGFTASALKTTNVFATGTIALALAVAALQGGASPAAARRWIRTGGALLAGAAAATLIWAITHNSIALIAVADDPALEGLRNGSRSAGVVLRSAVALIWPLTGDPGLAMMRYYSPDTLARDVQIPVYALLLATPLAIGLSPLFTTPRKWPHVVALIALLLLCLGGVVMALGFMFLYDQDPNPSPRYGISLAPLFVLALAAAVVDRPARRAIGAFAAALLVVTTGALLA